MKTNSAVPAETERSVLARETNPFVMLQQEIDRLFSDFNRGYRSPAAIVPRMDVSETDKTIGSQPNCRASKRTTSKSILLTGFSLSAVRRNLKGTRRTRIIDSLSVAMGSSQERSSCPPASIQPIFRRVWSTAY
jgi:hypothetical protein